MIDSEIIVVGGGPAGSSCARALKRYGFEVMIIDREGFPRIKPCAGWITPAVLQDLEFREDEYPFTLERLRHIHFHFFGIRIPVPTRQYAIRRYEFDRWLVERTGVPLYHHRVRTIRKEGGRFILDDTYRCRFLVGAGGTSCPVRRTFFDPLVPREGKNLIVTLEEEFSYDRGGGACRLWFFDHGLPGYSWYVPKGKGFVNVGIGAKFSRIKARNDSLRRHWDRFVEKLERQGLVKDHPYNPRGHAYYLRTFPEMLRRENALIVGDAAGLATVDMGEGIGPAVRSGILAADAIINGGTYSLNTVPRYSAFTILSPLLSRAGWK